RVNEHLLRLRSVSEAEWTKSAASRFKWDLLSQLDAVTKFRSNSYDPTSDLMLFKENNPEEAARSLAFEGGETSVEQVSIEPQIVRIRRVVTNHYDWKETLLFLSKADNETFRAIECSQYVNWHVGVMDGVAYNLPGVYFSRRPADTQFGEIGKDKQCSEKKLLCKHWESGDSPDTMKLRVMGINGREDLWRD